MQLYIWLTSLRKPFNLMEFELYYLADKVHGMQLLRYLLGKLIYTSADFQVSKVFHKAEQKKLLVSQAYFFFQLFYF